MKGWTDVYTKLVFLSRKVKLFERNQQAQTPSIAILTNQYNRIPLCRFYLKAPAFGFHNKIAFFHVLFKMSSITVSDVAKIFANDGVAKQRHGLQKILICCGG